jgi:hypothetical protein
MKRVVSLKLNVIAVFTALFTLLTFQPANAVQFATTMATTCNNTGAGTTWMPAIPFNVPESATVTRVDWQLYSGSAPTGELVYIRADNSGAPTGATLGTFTYSSISGLIVTMTGSATMSTAGRYWLVFKQAANIQVCFSTSPSYAGSPANWTMGTTYTWQSTDSGATFVSRNDYMVFNFTLFGVGGGVLPPSSSISISSAAISTYRQSSTITATLGVAGTNGKVTFLANGKRIPGCINKPSSALSVSCNWKPSQIGSVTLTANLKPTDSSYASSTSTPINVRVNARSGNR